MFLAPKHEPNWKFKLKVVTYDHLSQSNQPSFFLMLLFFSSLCFFVIFNSSLVKKFTFCYYFFWCGKASSRHSTSPHKMRVRETVECWVFFLLYCFKVGFELWNFFNSKQDIILIFVTTKNSLKMVQTSNDEGGWLFMLSSSCHVHFDLTI